MGRMKNNRLGGVTRREGRLKDKKKKEGRKKTGTDPREQLIPKGGGPQEKAV